MIIKPLGEKAISIYRKYGPRRRCISYFGMDQLSLRDSHVI